MDLFEFRGRVADVTLLGAAWVLAIMAPIVLCNLLPEIGNEFWILFVFCVAYFGYRDSCSPRGSDQLVPPAHRCPRDSDRCV